MLDLYPSVSSYRDRGPGLHPTPRRSRNSSGEDPYGLDRPFPIDLGPFPIYRSGRAGRLDLEFSSVGVAGMS